MRVVGFDPPTHAAPHPRVRVVRLSTPPPDVALEGCTVAGAWLTASVRQALAPEDPALVSAEIGPDPQSLAFVPSPPSSSSRLGDPFGDTELSPRSLQGNEGTRRPRALLCRIELQGFVRPELARRLSTRIDDNLRRRSPAYAWLRERSELEPEYNQARARLAQVEHPILRVLALESDDLHETVDMMRHLRGSQARRHVREEVPFFTGRRLDGLDAVVDVLR